MKRLLKILGWIITGLIALFLLAFLVVYLNRDRIGERLKSAVNDQITATFGYDDLGVTLRYFPNLGVRLTDLRLAGQGEFEGDTLARARSLDIAVDLFSLIGGGGQTKINRIHLEAPVVYLIVNREGRANYDIIKQGKESAQDSEGSSLNLALKSYSMKDAWIAYDDRQQDIYAEFQNLRHRGSGNFTEEIFDLVSSTVIPSATFRYSGIAYLLNVSVRLENTLRVNTTMQSYSFSDTRLEVNELQVNGEGAVQMADTLSYTVDFSAPENNFRQLLSVIPQAYTENFEDVEASGQFSLSGEVRSGSGDFPFVKVDVSVQDGAFNYPGAPFGFNQIALTGKFYNPGTTADATVIDIPQLGWVLEGRPFEAALRIEEPVSDPALQGEAEGSIDLSSVGRAFPDLEMEELSGLIRLDLGVKGRLSDAQSEAYERIELSGEAVIENLVYDINEYPPFRIRDGRIDFSPQEISLINLEGSFGTSDFKVKGRLSNALAILSRGAPIAGNFTIRSERMNVNEWIPAPDTSFSALTAPASVPSYYNRLDLELQGEVGTIVYEPYTFQNGQITGHLKGQKAIIESARFDYEGNRLNGEGEIGNLWNYSFLNQALRGSIDIRGEQFDLNPLMETPTLEQGIETAEQIAGFVVPGYLDFEIRASFQSILFKKLDLKNVNGRLLLYGGVATFEELRTDVLGGNMVIDGTYDSSDPQKPALRFNYGLVNLGFQPAFAQFNTFASFAPVAEYIQGRFNSTMSFEADLQPNLLPVLSTVDASGFLQTVNAAIRGFPPLEAVGKKLELDFLRNIDLENTKNRFEISDGKVTVEPFTIDKGDYQLTISGTHGIDRQMDYDLQVNLPWSMMAGKIGQGQPLAALREQASKLGIALEKNIRVDLLINLTGSIADPRVSFSLVGAGKSSVADQVRETIKNKADSLKKKGSEKLDTLKRDLAGEIDKNKQELSQQIDQKISSFRSSARERADLLKKEAQKLADKTREEGYARADDVLNAAGDNPLQKFAAEKAAKKIREETDRRVQQILDKADKEAQAILDRAEKRVDSLETIKSGQ